MFIETILFDLDGVLVDAAKWHFEALNKALKKVADVTITVKEHMEIYNGLSTSQKLETLIRKRRIRKAHVGDIQAEKQLRTISVIKKRCLPNDRVELLGSLSDKYKIGCVTNCITDTAKLMVKQAWLEEYISCIVTNQTTTRPKPFPDPYIIAMFKLKAKPWSTLVVEDNWNGIKSAKRAGVKYIHVLEDFGKLTDIVRRYDL